MAVHNDLQSMLTESLPEMLLVAKYCIEFHKDPELWGSPGCYGYPASLLLLSIVDSIGSHIYGGNADKRFRILNDPKYFGLNLTPNEVSTIKEKYRDLLAHNSLLAANVELSSGNHSDPVLISMNGRYRLNIVPLYDACVKVVVSLLNNPNVLGNSPAIENINKKIKLSL